MAQAARNYLLRHLYLLKYFFFISQRLKVSGGYVFNSRTMISAFPLSSAIDLSFSDLLSPTALRDIDLGLAFPYLHRGS